MMLRMYLQRIVDPGNNFYEKRIEMFENISDKLDFTLKM